MEIRWLRSSILQRPGLRVPAQQHVAKNSVLPGRYMDVSEITLGLWFCGTDGGRKRVQEQGRVYARGLCLGKYYCSLQIPQLTYTSRIFGSHKDKTVLSVFPFSSLWHYLSAELTVFFCENHLHTPVWISSVSRCVASSHPELAVIPHRQILAGMRESLNSEPSEKWMFKILQV